jgi:multidrug efflux system membrane fusion protein
VNIKTIDPLYVDFTLPETELVKVRSSMDKGQLEVEVTLQGDEGNKYAGTLELIGNTVDISTGTMSLRAVVPNKERKLWPGQFVRVRLILGTEEKATLVPYEAVQLGQKGSYLFVVTADNKADLRLVTTGQQVDDDIVIKEGVQPAEKVVISGQMGLSPGVSVAEVKNEPGR